MKKKIEFITSKIIEKVKMQEKQTRHDKAFTRNILKSSIGPQFKEELATLIEKHAEENKSKAAWEK
jgi:hypothetical protein